MASSIKEANVLEIDNTPHEIMKNFIEKFCIDEESFKELSEIISRVSEDKKIYTPEGGKKTKGKRPQQEVSSFVNPFHRILNPQVTHEVKWESGDRVINGIYNYFTNTPAPTPETEYLSFESEEEGYFENSQYEIILAIIIISAYFLLRNNSTNISLRHLFLVLLGIAIVGKLAGTMFNNLEVHTLLSTWSSMSRSNESEIDMEEVFEPQGIDFGEDPTSGLILSFITLLSGHKAKKSLLDSLLNVTKISKTQTENMSTALIGISTRLHSFFTELEYYDVAKYFFVESISNQNIMRLQDRVYQFVSYYNTGNPESLLTCQSVYHEYMKEISNFMKTTEKNSFDFKVLNDCQVKLTSIFGKIQASKVSLNGNRFEPVGILLKGSPSTMKGVLAQRIASVIARATLPKEWMPAYLEDKRGFFYSLPNDKFWEQYDGKVWVTFCDDIFQARDSVGNAESEALKIIKMINSAPYVLEMADVSSKNNVFFRSAFVVATTNLTNWNMLESVVDPSAVSRRFHLEVDVQINHKYTHNDCIDWSKLPCDSEHDTTQIPNDFWHLILSVKQGSTIVKRVNVTLPELIQMCIARHLQHIKQFNANTSMEDSLVMELAEELGYSWNNNISPQGGVTDPYTASVEKLSKFSVSDLHKYEYHYLLLCHRLGRMDLAVGSFRDNFAYLLHDVTLPENFSIRIPDIDYIIKYMESVLKTKITARVHPYTGIYEGPPKAKSSYEPLENIKKNFKIFSQLIKDNWQIVLIGGLVTAVAVKQLYDFFNTVISANPESVDQSRLGKRHVGKQRVIKLSSRNINTNINAQGALPPDFEFGGLPNFKGVNFGPSNNKTDVMAKIFNKYFYILYLVDHNTKDDKDYEAIRWGHMINLKGQLFIMPMHFILLLNAYTQHKDYKGSTMVMTTTSGSNRYSIDTKEFMNSFLTTESAADQDVCLVKIECSQKMSIGALPYFLENRDLDNLMRTTSFSGQIIGSYNPQGMNTYAIRNTYTQVNMNQGSITVNATWEKDGGLVYKLSDIFMYKWEGSKGDCGSMLFVKDGNFTNRILCGIHVAGGDGNGFSVCLTKENIERLIAETFGDEQTFVDEEKPEYLIDTSYEAQGGLQPIYDLDPKYVPMEPYKSEITKSRLHKMLPEPYNVVNTLPAKLKKFYNAKEELIDPLEQAFKKYGKISPDLEIDYVNQAIQSYENLFIQNNKISVDSRKIYSLMEVLHSFENINSISSSTSSGFPMSCNQEEDLKKNYYQAVQNGNDEEVESAYLRIATLVESTIQKYKNQVRPFFAYKQCGKDETRELQKVLMGKTRLFSACPFVLLLLFRMYFGSFISSYISSNIKIGSAVGLNPYSNDWDTMARMLLKFSNSNTEEVVAAGDQGQFDTRQWTLIHNKILDMINRFYVNASPEENYIRTALFMEITNSRHVFRGRIYEWHSGLPSGNPITAILNTIYNNIVFRVSWGYAGLEINKFNDNCVLMVLGDDNIFSVKAIYRHIFNELTLPVYMAKCGMEYTTELKGSALYPFRALSDCEFLKRTFYLDKKLNRWIAPLRESAIAEMLNWTKKGKEGDQITLDNMCFALREFSLHGKHKFNSWKIHLLELKQKLFPDMKPHGDMPLDFGLTYSEVLRLEYYF